ncbi:calcium-binding protein [Streptomyces bauhiniae]|uniref:calcium-binding protein n=1 Tax=Streptomyces bauhiniae TaxID=2340725 RepID=UPI00364807FF
MRTFRTIAAATGTLALALGSTALALPAVHAAVSTATVVHQDGELWYQAAPGQRNRLTVAEQIEHRGEFDSYYVLTFHDRYDIALDASAVADNECAYPAQADHTTVRCAVHIPENSDDSDDYDVDLGDLDDTATLGPDSHAYARVNGGPGDDVLQGPASAILHGDDGNDRLDGGGGPFGFGSYGDAGNDVLTHCGQDCFGGAGNDSLTGTDEENTLHGDDGADVLHGGGGADVLYGEAGDDTLWGNSGDDVLWGGPGTDRLSGGPGRNQVHQG